MAQHYGIKRASYSLALTHGASVTTVNIDNVTLNGILQDVIIKTPATVDGAATATINLIDQDTGATVYTKGSLAANTTTQDHLMQTVKQVALSGSNYRVQVVFSANQTTTDSVTTVALLIQSN